MKEDKTKEVTINIWKVLATVQVTLIVSFLLGMLWAFPLMWAWNYTMTYLFGLPTVTWLHMWLLYSILVSLWKINTVSVK